MLPRPRGRRAARFCFIGARFSKCSGCISGANQMGRFLDHHRRNAVHLIRYRRIFKTPLPGKCRFMRWPAPFRGGIAAGTTQIQGPLAVGARVSGRPPSLPGPVRRSGLESFAAPIRCKLSRRSGPTVRPGYGAHRNRDAAAHVTPHRDTHPQLLWETLLICRPERPQRTEGTLFPSHCTTYVHFPYAPIFITIQIVNRINGVPAASICLKHRRRTPPDRDIPTARPRSATHTHGLRHGDGAGRERLRPSLGPRPARRRELPPRGKNGMRRGPVEPAQSNGIPNSGGRAPATRKARRRDRYRTPAPCGSAPASMASISSSDRPK